MKPESEDVEQVRRFVDAECVLARAKNARIAHSSVALLQSIRPTQAAIQKYYCSFAEQIRTAIGSWKAGEPLPVLEGEAEAFLFCRIACALAFIQQLYLVKSIATGTNPLVLKSDTESFVKWLLIEWFETHGALQAYMLDYADIDYSKTPNRRR